MRIFLIVSRLLRRYSLRTTRPDCGNGSDDVEKSTSVDNRSFSASKVNGGARIVASRLPLATATRRGCDPGIERNVIDFGSTLHCSRAFKKKYSFMSPRPTRPTDLPARSCGFLIVFGWAMMATVARLVDVATMTTSPPTRSACTVETPALCAI